MRQGRTLRAANVSGKMKTDFSEVRPNLFWFHPPDGGEVYVASTSAGLVLFDSGFLRHKASLVRAMHEAGLDPATIRLAFATHFHADHVGGMGAWREEFGFPVAAHERAAEAMASADPVVTGARMPYVGFDEETTPCAVDRIVRGGEEFAIGDRTFSVVMAPGHTVGSIHIRSDDLLFVGDTLFSDGTIGWMDVHWGSNPADYLKTLDRTREHVGCLTLAGHGEPFVLEEALIGRAKDIVSFYIPTGHGLGSPRPTSQYAGDAGPQDAVS